MKTRKIENPELGISIRVAVEDGKRWFFAADVVAALGYSRKGVSGFLRKILPEHKGNMAIDGHNNGRQLVFLTLGGVGELVSKSNRLPEDKRMAIWDWICKEPSVREPAEDEDKGVAKCDTLGGTQMESVDSVKPAEETLKVGTLANIPGMQTFTAPDKKSVRVILKDGEPWFVGKDVADALEYKDTSDALKRHVDDEDKGVGETPTPRGKQNTILINESGMYSLIFGSKLPSARQFKRWVTSEVLPSIRKHGAYTAEKAAEYPESLQSVLAAFKEDRERLIAMEAELQSRKEELKKQSKELAELKSRSSYADAVAGSQGLLTVSVIAKEYGSTAERLNRHLAYLGIQYKVGGTWVLTSPYVGKGYTATKTGLYVGGDGEARSYIQTCWTQRGRQFLYNVLKGEGILPLSEIQV